VLHEAKTKKTEQSETKKTVERVKSEAAIESGKAVRWILPAVYIGKDLLKNYF